MCTIQFLNISFFSPDHFHDLLEMRCDENSSSRPDGGKARWKLKIYEDGTSKTRKNTRCVKNDRVGIEKDVQEDFCFSLKIILGKISIFQSRSRGATTRKQEKKRTLIANTHTHTFYSQNSFFIAFDLCFQRFVFRTSMENFHFSSGDFLLFSFILNHIIRQPAITHCRRSTTIFPFAFIILWAA